MSWRAGNGMSPKGALSTRPAHPVTAPLSLCGIPVRRRQGLLARSPPRISVSMSQNSEVLGLGPDAQRLTCGIDASILRAGFKGVACSSSP
jgi:hypothetical protein